MAHALLKKLDPAQWGDKLQRDLSARRDELKSRRDRVEHQLRLRRELALGKLRDSGLERVLRVRGSLVEAAASAVSGAQQIVPAEFSVLDTSHRALRERAEAIHKQRDGLSVPAIANYDQLNVKRIQEHLDALTLYELDKVRLYEMHHKNRVTVLRAVDRKLQP